MNIENQTNTTTMTLKHKPFLFTLVLYEKLSHLQLLTEFNKNWTRLLCCLTSRDIDYGFNMTGYQ